MRILTQLTIFGMRLAPLLLAVYWIALFTGTHLPGAMVPKQISISDKVMHFSAFAGLAFLLAWALPRRVGRVPGVVGAIVIVITYAVIDEWTQGFVPRRRPDVADFIADMLGMAVGLVLYFVLRWWLFLRRREARRLAASEY